MTYHLTAPTCVQATIALPASKSISNRALILHALARGAQPPRNLSRCDDTDVMVRAFNPGCPSPERCQNPLETERPAAQKADETATDGPGTPQIIDIKAAGTAMRFLTAYLSVTPGSYLLTGTARMQQRPIGILVDALRWLGADIDYAGQEGFPPLLIRGRDPRGGAASATVTTTAIASAIATACASTTATAEAGPEAAQSLTLPANISSQYISALLMIGPLQPGGLRLTLTGDIISRPYIDLTLNLMRRYGAEADWTDRNTLTVTSGNYHDAALTVESDWSAASYWYEVLALNAHGLKQHPLPIGEDEGPVHPSVELLGLSADSPQGDSRVAELFGRLGVRTAYTDRGVRLSPMGLPVARLIEDLTDTPDLAQTLVVTCCLMGIPFRIGGLKSLRIKETDRIAALQTELHRLGYVVREEQPGLLTWNGERSPLLPDPVVQTYDDHRMAMAFAPACLTGTPIAIDHPEVVTKSYPNFWDHLRLAGFTVD